MTDKQKEAIEARLRLAKSEGMLPKLISYEIRQIPHQSEVIAALVMTVAFGDGEYKTARLYNSDGELLEHALNIPNIHMLDLTDD